MLTSDPEILDTVRGMHITFTSKVPLQRKVPHPIPLNAEESAAVSAEIQTLLYKGVVVHTTRTGRDHFSTVFTRPKASGGYRMILNLSKLNDYVEYQHFKMDSAQTAINLMKPYCWMGSLDLTDAYYSIFIHPKSAEYLKFEWQGQMYKFVCCPNGISSGPRKFTKLLKPIFATLRKMNYIFVGYIDDSWNMDDEYDRCLEGIHAGNELFQKVGFLVSKKKSVMIPTHRIEFLGLILDSIQMLVFLTVKKTEKIKRLCVYMLNTKSPTIRQLSRLIGNFVAALPAAQYGRMHYRHLERFKDNALKQNGWDWDAKCTPTMKEKQEIQWWLENVDNISKPILDPPIQVYLQTDSSAYAWGAHCEGKKAQNYFSEREIDFDINTKEMLAVKYGLACFSTEIAGKHVLVECDNVTAVSYVREMGGTKHGLRNQIALDIWNWAIDKSVWITITHLPGVSNFLADEASRTLEKPNTEWALEQNIFDQIIEQFGLVDIDMFASCINNKLPRYVSWHRDPYSVHVDAFTLDWTNQSLYVFSPFSVIPRIVHKLNTQTPRKLIIVYPEWPTQAWYPALTRLLKRTMPLPRKSVYNPVKVKTRAQAKLNQAGGMPNHIQFMAGTF